MAAALKAVTRVIGVLVGLALLALALFVLALVEAPGFFTYHTSDGRLTIWSDEPFDEAAGQRVLADVEKRLATSPLDDYLAHAIFIANARWREDLFFGFARGAAGVNYYPLTNNVFLRHSDIDHDQVFGRRTGKPAAPPRTLAYYAAHEITHSFTAEHLGAAHLWNHMLPQWVREGYADYIGMGSQVDWRDLYRHYQAHDPQLTYRGSGLYAEYRMLTAYFLEHDHWTVDRLLASRLSLADAHATMDRELAASGGR
ncbi:MAG TPA: hypothetical protein VME40_14130 [Caulobacteraceae bacterium]|nr:hypothetical protein [Caulobacteraceae bacterium]